MEPSQNSKSLGGRPRKYTTSEDSFNAHKKSKREWIQQSRALTASHFPTRPVDFIIYEPPAPIPPPTNPSIGLRTSAYIRLPQLPTSEIENETIQGTIQRPILDIVATIELEQLREQDKELISEEIVYNKEIHEAISLTNGESNSDPFQSPILHTPGSDNIQFGNRSDRTASSSGKSNAKARKRPNLPAQKNNLNAWVRSRSSHNSIQSSVLNSALSSPLPTPFDTPPQLLYKTSVEADLNTPTANSLLSVPESQVDPTPRSPVLFIKERSVAYDLAKHLWQFQGCTHEQHQRNDQKHTQYHTQPDIHRNCSSIHDIAQVISGGVTPLPDILGNLTLSKGSDFPGLNCKAAFEGTDSNTPPVSLCLTTHHSTSRKRRPSEATFDIDSITGFVTSPAVAKQGLFWYNCPYPVFNLTADIHFGLPVTQDGKIGYAPLHEIPHYCFGSFVGMPNLAMYIFFPELYASDGTDHSTYISVENYTLWYDEILSPAITNVIKSSNALLYIPATARVALADSKAVSEKMSRDTGSRTQLLSNTIQPQFLDAIWIEIQNIIARDPNLSRFGCPTLFISAKKTKDQFSTSSFEQLVNHWKDHWATITDPDFYSTTSVFVDLAKQVSSSDSTLLSSAPVRNEEAEVYLWKKCCLESYAKTRIEAKPKVGNYSYATMRDAASQTLSAKRNGSEAIGGLIYTQQYNLIKVPFDAAKTYIFENEGLENLALDPLYILSLQQEGKGQAFSVKACQFSYLKSKHRAYVNLQDNQRRSYGVREESRVSLSLLDEVYNHWRDFDIYETEQERPLPYYIIPTKDLLRLLYAQINKYCFLFENVLATVSKTVSLAETAIMVVALRALRFCYSNSLIQREALLYLDSNDKKEGLGLKKTIEMHGFGWFLPKINWAAYRVEEASLGTLVIGNMLIHQEYRRRWKAVSDLRDVFVRFSQAERWFSLYRLQDNAAARRKWLEYLLLLNIEQFDLDVNKEVKRLARRTNDRPKPIRHWSAEGLQRAIREPHFVLGNKMHFETTDSLLQYLFSAGEQKRAGWAYKPFRVIFQKTTALIAEKTPRELSGWTEAFKLAMKMTHWVLPYPTSTALIGTTKVAASRGLESSMMWFSSFTEGDVSHEATHAFSILELARKAKEFKWRVGRRMNGTTYLPITLSGYPPRLALAIEIRDLSFEDLDARMVEWSLENDDEDVPSVEVSPLPIGSLPAFPSSRVATPEPARGPASSSESSASRIFRAYARARDTSSALESVRSNGTDSTYRP